MMKVLRIGSLGTRTENFEQTAHFFQEVLGLQSIWTKPNWAGFQLPTGKNDFVEVFSPSNSNTDLYPEAATGTLVAFIVEDLPSPYAEISAAGVDLLSEIIWAGDNFGWFFLRAPDGNIYCIEQVPE